jgi:hypothetical protein
MRPEQVQQGRNGAEIAVIMSLARHVAVPGPGAANEGNVIRRARIAHITARQVNELMPATLQTFSHCCQPSNNSDLVRLGSVDPHFETFALGIPDQIRSERVQLCLASR